MNGFSSSSLLLLLILSCSAAQGAPAVVAQAPHEIAPPIPTHNGTGATDSDAGVGYEESPPPAISVEQVGKPSTDGFGTLTEANGGLPVSVWKESSRESVDPLLTQITGVASEPIRDLAIRLLMTESQPPQGNGNDWLTLRINALAGLGQDEKITQMIAALPPSLVSWQIQQFETELELAHGDYDKACKRAQPDASAISAKEATFWQKVNIVCQIKNGKHDEALVGLDVLSETDSNDPFFQDAVRHINDKNIPIKTYPKVFSLFDFALIRLSGDNERLKDKIDALPAIAVKYLAEDTAIDVKLREKATGKAQQLGIIPAVESNKLPEQPFEKPLASDVITLVTALGSGNPPNDADNAVIARLALDDAGIQDTRRIQRLLTLMEIFGYKVQAGTWQKLFAHKNRFDGEVPPAVMIDRLNTASAANRKGEVILLAAIIADGNEADKMSDLTLIPIVKALKSTGFEKEARTLAYSSVKLYH